jgi:uncharacterized protein YjiK
MIAICRAVVFVSCLAVAEACGDARNELSVLSSSSSAVAREARLKTATAQPSTRDSTDTTDSSGTTNAPIARWVLPPALREVSGLALTSDGRMLVHGDELGLVWEIDYRRGILVKQFFLGDRSVKGDFEGIAVANGAVFMLASNGKLYEFQEGANGAHVAFKVHDTGLKAQCEFEGVAFDPTINALVLACKHVHDKQIKDAIVIYRWSLASDSSSRLTQMVVPVGAVLAANGWKKLSPSDITVDPRTGNYVLVASQEKALISITPAGALVFARPLPGSHPQAEGVAITKDGILVVSDEGGGGSGIITLYKWP